MARKYRIKKEGKEARQAIKKGIDHVADAVKITLGSYGRNAIIENFLNPPRVTNDGVTIAKNLAPMRDEIENLGADAIIHAMSKTNDVVGDGTTTTGVLTQAIINYVFEKLTSQSENLANSENVMEFRRRIMASMKNVVEKLKEKSTQIKDKQDLINVATASVEDEEFGKLIADMVEKVGKDGFIGVYESFQTEHQSEIINGMNFHGKYAHDFLITNKERKESEVLNPLILVTNHAFTEPHELKNLIKIAAEKNKRDVVIIAGGDGIGKYSDKVLLEINNIAKSQVMFKISDTPVEGRVNVEPGILRIFPLRAPSQTEEQLQDIAVYVQGTFIDQNKRLDKVTWSDLGEADKVIATQDDIAIFGGKATQMEIDLRVRELKSHLEMEKVPMLKMKIERRIACLVSGVGSIKIGTNTTIEREYLQMKVEDAIYATQASLEEGYVKGGGLALKEIAETLSDDDILKEALLAPYKQIQENAGGSLDIPDNVIDPTKVVRVALENACSLASSVITTEVAVAEHEETLQEALQKLLSSELRFPEQRESI